MFGFIRRCLDMLRLFDTFSPKSPPQKQGSKERDLLPANSFFQNSNCSTFVSTLESPYFEIDLGFSFFFTEIFT